MSIQPVVIPVPTSGDGLVVDVSALTGPKTVLLSGQFRGYYDLLGSQDDVHFVAVASFDAGGVEGIKQTVAGAFKSFRLRSNATQVTPVSCEVSGVVGQNFFATVASLPVGAGGTTPPIDTYAFAPPTGPEADISFLCTGGFRGSVVVLGSLDDVAYNPVGSFKVDRLPEGSSEALSFPPLVTQDKVRYVKLQLTGLVTSPLTVTAGGSVPSGSSPSSQNNLSIVSNGSVGYVFQGRPAATNPVVDDLLNTVQVAPANVVVCVGARNRVDSSNDVFPGTVNPFVVLGIANTVLGSPSPPAALGHVLVAGEDNTVQPNVFATSLLGYRNRAGLSASGCLAAGTLCNIGDNASNVVAAGVSVQVGARAGSVVAVGNGLDLSTNSAISALVQIVMVGYNVNVSNPNAGFYCNDVVAIGSNITASANTANLNSCVLVGSNLNMTGSLDDTLNVLVGSSLTSACVRSILIGNSITETDTTSSAARNILLGNDFQVGDGSSGLIVVGPRGVTSTLANSFYSIFMGSFLSVGSSLDSCVVLGVNATVGDSSSYVTEIGNTVNVSPHANAVVAIGHGLAATVDPTSSGFGNLILIGDNLNVSNPNASTYSDHLTVIGNDNTVVAGTTGDLHYCTVVGQEHNVTGANYCAVVGSNLTLLPGGSSPVNGEGYVIVGDQCQVLSTEPSVAIGRYVQVNGAKGIGIGRGIIIEDSSVVVGDNSNPVGNVYYAPSGVYVGLSQHVGSSSGASQNTLVGHGASIGDGAVYCTIVGAGASGGAALGNHIVSCTIVGANAGIGDFGDHSVAVQAIMGDHCSNSVALGGSVANGSNHAVTVGIASSTAGAGISVGGASSSVDLSIALGYLANASVSHTMEIGAGSDPSLDLGINVFTVRGSQGTSPAVTNIVTLQATTAPASGELGLTVTYNTGATIVNKTVKAIALASLPVGSLVLYVDP